MYCWRNALMLTAPQRIVEAVVGRADAM